jgi:hypothetical protein
MLFKMESNTSEVYVKRNSEFNRAFIWDVRTIGQGVSNEGGQLLDKGQDMGPLLTKLDDADSLEDVIYYGVSIPRDANVSESDGK